MANSNNSKINYNALIKNELAELKIGQPTLRALDQLNICTLTDLSKLSEKELNNLHGLGPKAIGILKEALGKANLYLKTKSILSFLLAILLDEYPVRNYNMNI